MKMKKEYTGVAARVFDAVSETIVSAGYDVWDISFGKRGADYVLEITIDAPGGIGIDDCEKVSRAVDPILDEADPIDSAYLLEVSSPGIERDLSMPRHFDACAGKTVSFRLFSPDPVTGCKNFRAVTTGYDAETDCVNAEYEGKRLSLPFRSISSAKLFYDFDSNKI